MIRRRLPITFYNWTSTVGAFMAVTSFSIIILLFLIDLMVERTTIYLGLLTYVFLPSILVFGLILIAAGALIERRRLAQGKPSFFPKQISVDLTNPVHRDTMVIVAVVGILFLLGTSIGTYKAYQATESVAFCGTLCHRVMNPEHTAYQTSSHARVACVRCHIGPGADWFVKSKLSGLYQVYATLAHKFPQPIPTPIKDLRPARDTCLECHWPEKFFGSRRNVYPHYLADEKNTPNPISLLIHIGGGSEKQGPVEGIHWHMAVSNQVEYIARDKERQEIAWVRVTDKKGNVTEYQHAESPLTPEERGKATVRAMDCIDCHNRPSHVYRSPLRAVNEAMATGDISPTLPYVKREAVKALDSDYADTATAAKEIQAKLLAFYQENHPDVAKDRPADLDAAVAVVQKIYRQNFFPEMKVSWRKYPDHIGHFQFAGCFRCHGSPLTSDTGKTITNDCAICHSIIRQGPGRPGETISPAGLVSQHPVDIGGAEKEGHCSACHTGGAELY